jgi:saccharopine dehydrogenase-like NADP-dependent oxidoreductase
MAQKVLIIGGQGRIGRSVAIDILTHTHAQVILTGRSQSPAQLPDTYLQRYGERIEVRVVNLDDIQTVNRAIASSDLVIHCAGPFRQRQPDVLAACIGEGVGYLDVSDDRQFTIEALKYREAAKAKGVTAVINTGVFPGISNSLVRQGVEQLDLIDRIQLDYGVAGSGGAGVTVLRTTFLNIQHPFQAWIAGKWQQVEPYTAREIVSFPAPFGKTGVYWFDMPETLTLVDSFPANTVVTKFGSVPDFYNRMTELVARWFPKRLMQRSPMVEGLSQIGYRMTTISDRWSGTGVAVQARVTGTKQGKPELYRSTFVHGNAAIATGCGTGGIAQLILAGQLKQPGVWAVEQVLPTPLFMRVMAERNLHVEAVQSGYPS